MRITLRYSLKINKLGIKKISFKKKDYEKDFSYNNGIGCRISLYFCS